MLKIDATTRDKASIYYLKVYGSRVNDQALPFLNQGMLRWTVFFMTVRFSSSMEVLQGGCLVHGLAVVPDQQTQGRGRGGNLWISPPGAGLLTEICRTSKKSMYNFKFSICMIMRMSKNFVMARARGLNR